MDHSELPNGKEKKLKSMLKGVGSVLLAIIASSHHWVHTLLVTLGLTTLGAGLLIMPPMVRLGFLLLSIVISIRFIFVSKRKWNIDRPCAWVYLVSSTISIVLVTVAIPQSLAAIVQPVQNQELQKQEIKGQAESQQPLPGVEGSSQTDQSAQGEHSHNH